MQLVDLNKLYPKKFGVSDPLQLKSDETVIYDSDTLISTMNYSGSISTIIHEASGISSYLKNQLKAINRGYCSLGGQWNNANFYGPNARSLSGSDRICYVRGINPDKDDKMVVVEYYGSRGSKFSGYYSLLLKKVRQNSKFKIDSSESFIVDRSNIGEFVDIMNSVMNDIIDSKLVMIKVPNKYDKIKIEGNHYYYNVVIWDYAENHRPLEKELEESLDLKQHLEMLVKYLVTRDSINVDGVEINVKTIRENKLRQYGLSVKEMIMELSGYIEAFSDEADKIIELIDGSISGVYDGLTKEMVDDILGCCGSIKEYTDILEPYTAEKIEMAVTRIEEILNTEELRHLSKFNIQNYEEVVFRRVEEEFGYNEDKSDDRINSASGNAVEKGEELYYNAEKLLEELKAKFNEICM